VLKEYKVKFNEFQSATKSSKQNHKKFAKEVNVLANKKKALEVEFRNLCKSLNI